MGEVVLINMSFPTNKKCLVCHDQVTNGAYYDNKLCISCQQFYSRSVAAMNSSSSFSYACTCASSRNGNDYTSCVITKETRNACKHCRYSKCQACVCNR